MLLRIVFFIVVVFFLFDTVIDSSLHLLLLKKLTELFLVVAEGLQVAVAHEDFHDFQEFANEHGVLVSLLQELRKVVVGSALHYLQLLQGLVELIELEDLNARAFLTFRCHVCPVGLVLLFLTIIWTRVYVM